MVRVLLVGRFDKGYIRDESILSIIKKQDVDINDVRLIVNPDLRREQTILKKIFRKFNKFKHSVYLIYLFIYLKIHAKDFDAIFVFKWNEDALAIINKVKPLNTIIYYDLFVSRSLVAINNGHWLPSGVSLYENTYHLVPNHYIKASEYEQKRYYPFENLSIRNYSESVIKFSSLLKNIVSAANNNMDLAFTLTAGYDSRTILSSCKDIIQDITTYTFRYRNMEDRHMDIRIPMSLSKSLNFNYNIIDCQTGITPDFSKIYLSNTDMAHINDWGIIAFGLSKTYPQEKVSVKGVCAEVGRCFYYRDGNIKKNITENDLLQLVPGWSEFSFIREEIKKWNESIKKNSFNYNIYDLFYWEHRTGGWQAQSQLEFNIVQEEFTPFNSRELLDIILSVDVKKRNYHKPILFIDAMRYLWKDVMTEPINPAPFKKKMRDSVVYFIRKTGLLPTLKKIFKMV